jgi:hypothetical protein
VNTKNHHILPDLLLNRKQMEVFLAGEVKDKRTYAAVVCNIHLCVLKICGTSHCLRSVIFLLLVLSGFACYNEALN